MGSNPTVTAIVMSRDIVPDRTHEITIFAVSFIFRLLWKDPRIIGGPMTPDVRSGRFSLSAGAKTFLLFQKVTKQLSFTLTPKFAMFKEQRDTIGNREVTIWQFS